MELALVDLKKKYKKVEALKGISLTLTPGIYGLLGPNGSGKSTLMNIITGNLRATSGKVLWDGEDIEKLGRKYRAVLGYVPQQQAMYPDFSVWMFLEYVAALRSVPKQDVPERIEATLRQTDLTEVAGYKVRMLSGGMKQRLLIAQAILHKPQLLVMDEPTVGLDPQQRQQIRDLIQTISHDKIVLIATHIVSDLELISDEALLIRKGELIKRGKRADVISETREEAGGERINTLEDVYLYYFGDSYGKTDIF